VLAVSRSCQASSRNPLAKARRLRRRTQRPKRSAAAQTGIVTLTHHSFRCWRFRYRGLRIRWRKCSGGAWRSGRCWLMERRASINARRSRAHARLEQRMMKSRKSRGEPFGRGEPVVMFNRQFDKPGTLFLRNREKSGDDM